MSELDIIKKYADKIEFVLGADTIGDYTWIGLLVEFLREYEEQRSE